MFINLSLFSFLFSFMNKISKKSKVKLSPWKALESYRFVRVKDPSLPRQSAQMVVRLSALSTRRTLLPRNIIIVMFLVLISVRGWVDPRN
jgi:hypothetical protein